MSNIKLTNIFSKLSFIYISSILLFTLIIYEKECQLTVNYKHFPPIPFLSNQLAKLRQNFSEKNQELAPLAMSYLFGDRRGLAKEIKHEHDILGLGHLFTPAGIHLAGVILILWPLSIILKKRWRASVRSLMILVLSALIMFIPQHYSLKRLSLLRFAAFFIKHYFRYYDYYYIFLFLCIVDLAIGTYRFSPLSFGYSYLFLGTILATRNLYPRIIFPLAMLGAQIIISYFQTTPLTTIGFIFNFVFTLLFELFYPVMFITFWTNCYYLLEITLLIYKNIVHYGAIISSYFGFYYSSFTLLLIVISLGLKLDSRLHYIRRFFILMGLIIHCEGPGNIPANTTKYALNYKLLPQIYTLPAKEELTRTKNKIKNKFNGKTYNSEWYRNNSKSTRVCRIKNQAIEEGVEIKCRERKAKDYIFY